MSFQQPARGARLSAAVLATLVGAGACRHETGQPVPAPVASASASAPQATALTADRRVSIPSGKLLAGTVPGAHPRLPPLEPGERSVNLGAFQIDRLPFPNDPDQPPLLGASRERASVLCSQAEGRLCTELEWERACKGPTNDVFPGGKSWQCKSEHDCVSGFDVVGLGWRREWTASDVAPTSPDGKRQPATRGSTTKDPPDERHCSRRRPLPGDTEAPDVGFRCCYGPPNSASIAEPVEGPAFEKLVLAPAELTLLLKSHPATAPYAAGVSYFSDPDAAETVISRGPGDRQGFLFTGQPLLWNPIAGAKFLVVAARSGKSTSLVAAFHVIGKGEYSLAASFVMKDEPGPVVLAYSASIRPRLHFSSCWGCPGETGKVLYRDPDRVSVVQP